MNITPEARQLIEDCLHRSHNGSIDFSTVIMRLASVGVESYFADYRQRLNIYYFPSGETLTLPMTPPVLPVAKSFDAQAIQAAVREAQHGDVKYPEFMQRTMQAGCASYFVWIAGRHVQYLGRKGEQHIEPFPAQAN